ncbi:hypothetical protein R6Q59_016485, partial [Mikania micrantha]
MSIIPHQASLQIGERATFTPLLKEDLQTYHHNFATYKELHDMMEFLKIVTYYIERVEDVSRIMVRAGKTLRKIAIQDDR